MPFTPVHIGSGLLSKAILDRRISLISFSVAQVLMDIEPGVRMVLGHSDLHGWSHTLIGAAAIGAVATVVSPRLMRPLVRRWNKETHHYKLDWLAVPKEAKKWSVATGAFIGTMGHLRLDALIHADVHPYAPMSLINPYLGLLDSKEVYALCLIAGLIGSLAWVARKKISAWRARRRARRADHRTA